MNIFLEEIKIARNAIKLTDKELENLIVEETLDREEIKRINYLSV